MTKRNSYWTLLAIWLLTTPALARADEAAPAAPTDCQRVYTRMGSSLNVKGLAHRWTDAEYQKMSQTKVSDVFSMTTTLSPSGASQEVLDLTETQIEHFRAHFKDYVQAEGQKGLIPSDKLKAFTNWLKSTNAGEPYPKLSNFQNELTDFYKSGRTLKEFDEYVFLKKYLVDGPVGASPATIASYARSLDPSQLRYFKESSRRLLKYILSKPKDYGSELLKVGLLGAVGDTILGGPVRDAISKYGNSWKDWLLHQGKLQAAKVQIKYVQKDEQNLTEASRLISSSLKDWKAKNYFWSSTRNEAAMDFRSTEATIQANLSKFRPLLPQFDKDFDKTSEQELKDSQVKLDTKMSSYRSITKDLDDRKAKMEADAKDVAAGDATVSPAQIKADNEKLVQLKNDLVSVEGELATILSSYLLYKYTHGPKDMIPAALGESYENAYKAYLERMDIDQLRQRVIPKVEAEVKKITDSGLIPAPEDPAAAAPAATPTAKPSGPPAAGGPKP